MTRTDDELLALAAKAGAIDTTKPWAPLADDGDALDLMTKLGMLIDVRLSVRVTEATAGAKGRLFRVAVHHQGNPTTATRRAIVELAAAIGAMP